MTIRSLHVVASDARRGAETFAVDLVDAIASDGDHARVVALSPSSRPEPHALTCLGPSRRSWATLRGLRRAAAQVDVVVAHGSSTLEACVIALAGSRVPFVYRTIGDPSYWVDATQRRVIGMMLRRASRHVAIWPGAREQLIQRYSISGELVDVIANGVPGERFPLADEAQRLRARQAFGLNSTEPCLAYVGSLSPEKDVGAAIEAVGGLHNAILLIVGDGPERAALEARAANLSAARVRFLGPVPDPQEVYAAADLLVLPSRTEGMPAVVIEAGLSGTPTVASAVGAIPEMIDDGRTGFLVPPGDAAGLAARLRQALPTAATVGERAAEVFRSRYTMDRVVPLWRQTLRAVRPGGSSAAGVARRRASGELGPGGR